MHKINDALRTNQYNEKCYINSSARDSVRVNRINLHIAGKEWDKIPILQLDINSNNHVNLNNVEIKITVGATNRSTEQELRLAKEMHKAALEGLLPILTGEGYIAVINRSDRDRDPTILITSKTGKPPHPAQILNLLGSQGLINEQFVGEVITESFPKVSVKKSLSHLTTETRALGLDPAAILDAAIDFYKTTKKDPSEAFKAAQRIGPGSAGGGTLGGSGGRLR